MAALWLMHFHTATELSEHPFYDTMKILRETLLLTYERQIYKNSGNKNYLTPLFISYLS